jgi:hypothetical protein
MPMEPGGIEPPSRDSQQVASTRVYGDLISASGLPPSACPLAQFPVLSYPLPPATSESEPA